MKQSNTDPAQGHFLAELCCEKAGSDWAEDAYAFFVAFAYGHKFLTTAQARLAFEKAGGAVPHDGRAWGHICRRAITDGVIEHSGTYTRDGSHGRPNPVWASLVVRAVA
jgi:hypothetical protein